MRCLGVDFFVLFYFKICSFNSTEIFTVLNMEQTLIFSFYALIPVLYCSSVIFAINNRLIWKKNLIYFSPYDENLCFQANKKPIPGSGF